jgi:hypothetical protein
MDAGAEVDAGGVDWGACAVPSECILSANTCCGVCGMPELGDVDGVHRERTAEHYLAVCPDSADGPIDCPDCPVALNPDLIPTCAAGRCAVIDVGMEALSECSDDSECVVRVPDCCPCGADTSPYRLIALRGDRVGDYEARVCDPGTGCPECEPMYPADVRAICGAEGHCQIELIAP